MSATHELLAVDLDDTTTQIFKGAHSTGAQVEFSTTGMFRLRYQELLSQFPVTFSSKVSEKPTSLTNLPSCGVLMTRHCR